MKPIVSGWPQFRLRLRRMACHVGPVSANCAPPAIHPLAYPPNGSAPCREEFLCFRNNCLACTPRIDAGIFCVETTSFAGLLTSGVDPPQADKPKVNAINVR